MASAIIFPSNPTINDTFTSSGKQWSWDGSAWILLNVASSLHASTHISTGSDPITIAESQVTGLVSDLSNKASISHASTHASAGSDPITIAQSQVTGLSTSLSTINSNISLKSNINSPTFTGVVVAPTPSSSDNSTTVATTEFVKNQGYLTTASAASTYVTATSPTISSPILTGIPLAPTATTNTNTTQIATTAFVYTAISNITPERLLPVQTGNSGKYLTTDGTTSFWSTSDVSLKANINNPTFTGVPAAPTPSYGDNSTQIATTSFVQSAIQVIPVNNQSLSYTLVESDAGKIIIANGASANTITVPLNSSVAFAIGAQISIFQYGAGQSTVSGASGVTLVYTPGNKLRAQYSSATLIKIATNTWALFGDISP